METVCIRFVLQTEVVEIAGDSALSNVRRRLCLYRERSAATSSYFSPYCPVFRTKHESRSGEHSGSEIDQKGTPFFESISLL